MRKVNWALALLAAFTLLSGCKDFWDKQSSSGGGGNSATGVFYVLNRGTSQIAAYSLSKSSSTPTTVSGSPYTLGEAPLALAISTNGSYLYVSTASGIFLYDVGSSGALTLANNKNVISTDPATTMVVDPSGQWLIEAIFGTGTLNAIPLVTSTGLNDTTKSEQTVSLSSTNAQQVAVSPSSSTTPYAFVALGKDGTAVVPFAAGNTKPFGNLQSVPVVASNSGGADIAVGVDPSNRLVYVGETVAVSSSANNGQTGGLRAFNINSSSPYITEISGSPYASGGTGPSAILPTANYVYVANKGVSGSTTTGNIKGFAFTSTGTTYSLTPISTVAAGITTAGLAEDSSSTYVLAVNLDGSPDLGVYTFDATTAGKLNLATKVTTGSDPVQASAVVAVP